MDQMHIFLVFSQYSLLVALLFGFPIHHLHLHLDGHQIQALVVVVLIYLLQIVIDYDLRLCLHQSFYQMRFMAFIGFVSYYQYSNFIITSSYHLITFMQLFLRLHLHLHSNYYFEQKKNLREKNHFYLRQHQDLQQYMPLYLPTKKCSLVILLFSISWLELQLSLFQLQLMLHQPVILPFLPYSSFSFQLVIPSEQVLMSPIKLPF